VDGRLTIDVGRSRPNDFTQTSYYVWVVNRQDGTRLATGYIQPFVPGAAGCSCNRGMECCYRRARRNSL
jgi:hypothetical protein